MLGNFKNKGTLLFERPKGSNTLPIGLVTNGLEIGISRRYETPKSDFITVRFLILTSQQNFFGLKSNKISLV